MESIFARAESQSSSAHHENMCPNRANRILSSRTVILGHERLFRFHERKFNGRLIQLNEINNVGLFCLDLSSFSLFIIYFK